MKQYVRWICHHVLLEWWVIAAVFSNRIVGFLPCIFLRWLNLADIVAFADTEKQLKTESSAASIPAELPRR